MSLVEVILAVSLIGLIILFLFGLLPSTGMMVRQGERQVAAVTYAKEILAELESQPFGALKGAVGTLTPSSPGILSGVLEERRMPDETLLKPTVTITSVPPVDHLVQASVKVEWPGRGKTNDLLIVRRFSAVLK